LKFMGIMILSTKYEFQTRASLWSQTSQYKYLPAPKFGQTGMSRRRFDELWKYVRWSEQPSNKPDEMSSSAYHWLLIDGFVERFNLHRVENFTPSDRIAVDESISRWYGQGGFWINHGLPTYVAIDRKPEFGCEIQNSACGRSGVLLRLKIVKTVTEGEEEPEEAIGDGLNHGTKVLKFLVEPWSRSDRVVCADSYFASVNAAEELKRMGLRFIGVVKTATKNFPMTFLSGIELQQRGDFRGLFTKDADGVPTLLSFVWMDRDRRYFISSCSSLDNGTPYTRLRWRQTDQKPHAPPEKVELTIPQPKAAEVYYSTCGKIDQHNRCRQDTLCLERKLRTHRWDMRVNLSIFAMIVVDTWMVYSKCTNQTEDDGESQKDFYTLLAEELIDNTFDSPRRRTRHSEGVSDTSPVLNRSTGMARAGVGAHLTPTKRKRKTKDGQETKHKLQGRCMICSVKTSYLCSACNDDVEAPDITGRTPWVCHSETGRTCFAEHYNEHHLDENEA
jgi:hypothetical protein